MVTGIKVPEDDTIATGDELVHRLFLRGKAVGGKADDLFDLARDVLMTARLDNQKRVIEMLKESKAGLESSLVSSGHSYGVLARNPAPRRAAPHLTTAPHRTAPYHSVSTPFGAAHSCGAPSGDHRRS